MTEESRNNDKRKQDTQDNVSELKIGKPVVLKAEAYKTIILYASRYANQAIPSEDWKEIYGLLIGYYDDDFLYIERAIPMTYGHDTDVEFSETDYGDVEKIHEELDKEGKGYFIVGWFHSHPGLTLFFSYIDLINQLGFQGKFEDAIGLVFDHTLLGKKREEKRELPSLILESDIVDISSYSEVDTRNQIDAFIETLESVKKQGV